MKRIFNRVGKIIMRDVLKGNYVTIHKNTQTDNIHIHIHSSYIPMLQRHT